MFSPNNKSSFTHNFKTQPFKRAHKPRTIRSIYVNHFMGYNLEAKPDGHGNTIPPWPSGGKVESSKHKIRIQIKNSTDYWNNMEEITQRETLENPKKTQNETTGNSKAHSAGYNFKQGNKVLIKKDFDLQWVRFLSYQKVKILVR